MLSPSEVPPSDDFVAAPVNVTENIENFRSFPDARRLSTMHQDGDRLRLVDARYGGRHDTALVGLKKRWLLFNRNRASFLGSDKLLLHIPYVCYLEKREYVARFSTLVVLLKGIRDFPNQVSLHTVLDRAYDGLPFLSNLGRWWNDLDFERRVRTARPPTFTD